MIGIFTVLAARKRRSALCRNSYPAEPAIAMPTVPPDASASSMSR
jgi:hypothetical protein